MIQQEAEKARMVEEGRSLASERERLIAEGVNPSELVVPLHPDDVGNPPASESGEQRG